MADLVNATHKERLSQRDSEPTHLKAGGYDDLGGTGIDSEPNSVKINASAGVKGQDTSIIGAGQNSEKSHLKSEDEGDVDVKFDGDDDDYEGDELDKELDQFEDVEPVDVDVEVDDDEKKKDVKEDFDFDDKKKKEDDLDEDEEAGDAAGEMEKNSKEPEAAMNSGKNKVTEDKSWGSEKEPKDVEEGELPPWLKKKDKKEDDLDEDEIVIKKDSSDDDEEKKVEKDEKEPEEVTDKKIDESVHIRIKRPNVKLLESAGIPAKAQKKVALVFESVVKDVTQQVAKQMHAHYRKLHESKLAKRDNILAKRLDSYLNYVVEEWVKNNRVGIRSSLKTQLAEEFLKGFQGLMKEHYIEVPESKVDVVKQLSRQVSVLKKSLTEQTAQKLKLRRIAESANKGRIVAQFVKNGKLSEAQSAKLEKLTENVQYTNAKDFREKVGMLAESYFGNSQKKTVTKVAGTEGGKRLTEEKIQDEPKTGKTTSGDPDVDLIAATLARQAQSQKW